MSLILIVSSPAEDNTMILAYSFENPNSEDAKEADNLIKEAFKRMGRTVQKAIHPLIRANVLANSGELDGIPRRVKGFESLYPNLIMVEEIVNSFDFTAFSADKDIKLDGWSSLKDKGYRVIYFNGTFRCEEMLPSVIEPENLIITQDKESALKMLLSDRADVYIDVGYSVDVLLPLNEIFTGIYKAGVMERVETYLYLHKKHKALIPELEQNLREIKSEWNRNQGRQE